MFKNLVSIFTMIILLTTCGKSDLNYTGSKAPEIPDLPIVKSEPEINFVTGTLVMEKRSLFVRSGMLMYHISSDGTIAYEVYLDFTRRDRRYDEYFDKKFGGSIKVEPKTILSRTYRKNAKVHREKLLTLKVGLAKENISSVTVSVINPWGDRAMPYYDRTDYGAFGEFQISTKGEIIEIISANIFGKVFGTPVNLQVRNINSEVE